MKRRLALALLAAALAHPAASQTLPPLPDGVPAYADSRGQCYLPGEKSAQRDRIDSQRVALPGCPDPVIPPRATVESFRVYKRKSSSVIDCASLRANDLSSAYLDRFLDDLVKAADGKAGPVCAGAMVAAWAAGDAMTRISDEGWEAQSRLDRTWAFGGISAAYLGHPEMQAAARAAGTDAAILRWFQGIAGQISGEMASVTGTRDENNTQYWRAFAVLPTALLAGDADLLASARGVFDRAMDNVTTEPGRDGFLPFELRRGDKSLHYQIFAATPLVGMALLSEAYGCGFADTDVRQQRLAAVLARAVEGEFDPGIFEAEIARRTGKTVRQQPAGSAAAKLLYLANAADPALYDGVDARLARDLGEPRPVVPAAAGARSANDRLGGAYAALAQASATLRTAPPPPGLAGVCSR